MSSITAGPGRTSTKERRDGRGRAGVSATSSATSSVLDSPVATFYILIGTTIALTIFGLVMVFSASSVTSIIKDHSMTAIFRKQLMYAVIGAVVCAIAARMPVRFWKHLAMPALLLGVILQAAVQFTSLGIEVGGNRNWLNLPGVTLQPSEFSKVGLVLVGALVLANRRQQVWQARKALIPFVMPYGLVAIGLVLMGGDLGTVLVLVAIVAAALYVGGLPARWFAAAGAVAVAALVVLVLTSQHRMMRFTAMFTGCNNADSLECGQATHGRYAFAGGGWWGVGLGGSKEKWAWLSEAHNDFIFAVIGEELGLPGTIAVLVLFGLLAWACARLVLRSNDQFVRLAAAGIMAWIIVQAMANIGSVIGVFPVIGVPLPLISAGGTSLITTLLAIGILISFARAEPGARELLAARPGIWRRSVSVMPSRAPKPARATNDAPSRPRRFTRGRRTRS